MAGKNRVAEAVDHVTQGQHIVAAQRARIVRLAKAGRDVLDAENLLNVFEQTLQVFENDLRAIEEELREGVQN